MTATTVTANTEHTAVFFDGRSNRKRTVRLRFADGLDILEPGIILDRWPFDQVRRADGLPQTLRLRCATARPLARLEVTDAATQGFIAAYCRSLDVGGGAAAQARRIVGWSFAAISSILLLALFGVPLAADRLAPVVPFAMEQRIGAAVDDQVRAIYEGKTCTGAEGQAAFTKLVDRLKTAGGLEFPLVAHVLSSKTPNAYALPGGRIYMLEGLLKKAKTPDEVAGVLAHELGHVQHRDGLRRIIQTGGTSFLVGLLFGDVTGASAVLFVGRSLLDASYSRDQESDADAFAAEVMRKLGRSPKPMGELLMRMSGSSETMDLLASHPMSKDRLAAMSKVAPAFDGPELLSAAEWQALKSICTRTRED